MAGQTFRVASVTELSPPPKSATAAAEPLASLSGTLAMYHKDFFDEGRGEYGLAIRSSSGQTVLLNVAVVPEVLHPGMSIVAEGTLAASGSELATSSITILAAAPPKANDVAAAPVTNNVLVVPIKFTDSPASDPFTVAAINAEFQGEVRSYYNEVSYGQQLLSVTVASSGGGWINAEMACDAGQLYQFRRAVETLANAAGRKCRLMWFNPNNYQNVYYVMPPNNACGWAGLAYVGWGYCRQQWR